MSEADLKYTAPPTVGRMMRSNHPFRAIRGPFGSGKSVGCVVEVFRRCMQMPAGPDGKRRSRWAIIRQTNQQLQDTTLKTWLDWVKPGVFGRWGATDKTFYMKFNDVEAEILFRPLDTVEDVQRVLSLELSGAWINECRETPVEIVQALQGRIGRYPSRRMVPDYWCGMIADTNSPEIDSDWYKIFEHLPIEDGNDNSIMECDSFSQPSGLSPEAENIENLKVGYYNDLARGKTQVWVDAYVHNKYIPSYLGKPVYINSFKADRHVSAKPLAIDPYLPIGIGFDTGLTPAAVFKQMGLDGRVKVLREAAGFDMGMERFAKTMLRPIIKNFFPNNPLVFIGDPSMERRGDGDENSAKKVLRAMFGGDGAIVRAASTNDPDVRIQATEQMFSQWPDGEPLMVIDPCCKRYIDGLRSKYRYLKVRQTGQFRDRPDKNEWSHLVEAGQYIDLFYLSGKYSADDYTTNAGFNPFAQNTRYQPAQREGY